ncbi:MAG: hypothetical protein J2P54_24940, partial [Bradyrhizobiaceae bacterium]|nr:hypothetical protein [Bradyrhizobiaceae bacterium]
YMAVHSASPILYRKKPFVGSGVFWRRAGAAIAKLLSRPSAAPMTAADRITSRRDVVSIGNLEIQTSPDRQVVEKNR